MSHGESLCVQSILACGNRRILSSRTQPRFLRMRVRDLLFAFVGATLPHTDFGMKGIPPLKTGRGAVAICIRGSD
jgi:hypothetical protein